MSKAYSDRAIPDQQCHRYGYQLQNRGSLVYFITRRPHSGSNVITR